MILLSDRSTGAGQQQCREWERETASVIELTVHVIVHLSSLQSLVNDEESSAHVNVMRRDSLKEWLCLRPFGCVVPYQWMWSKMQTTERIETTINYLSMWNKPVTEINLDYKQLHFTLRYTNSLFLITCLLKYLWVVN